MLQNLPLLFLDLGSSREAFNMPVNQVKSFDDDVSTFPCLYIVLISVHYVINL